MATDLPSADDGGTPAASGMPEFTPPSTWRKKPSQKGKPRLRLVKHAWTTTPKRPVAPQHNRSRKAGDGVVGESRPKPVRRKRDLDGELRSTNTGAPAAVSGSFLRATLMDNLRSLAKLNLTDKPPPAALPEIDNPPRMPPASPKINLRSFSRAQLMENLRSLAKCHNVPVAAAATAAAHDEARDAKGKSRAKKPTMVDELVLVPYSRKRAAAAAGEDPFHMAVVVQGGPGAGTTPLVPRWTAVELARTRTQGRLVRGITPAIEDAYGQLMRLEETCRGEDLPDIPESPQLEEKRRDLEVRVKHFMNLARLIMGITTN